jgi:hypothetical protein
MILAGYEKKVYGKGDLPLLLYHIKAVMSRKERDLP